MRKSGIPYGSPTDQGSNSAEGKETDGVPGHNADSVAGRGGTVATSTAGGSWGGAGAGGSGATGSRATGSGATGRAASLGGRLEGGEGVATGGGVNSEDHSAVAMVGGVGLSTLEPQRSANIGDRQSHGRRRAGRHGDKSKINTAGQLCAWGGEGRLGHGMVSLEE